MPRVLDLAGCVLDGRYELHELVGEGAFGRVYRGRDRRLARTVAVKVIKPGWADDVDWEEIFEREAQLLARVSHTGIMQIFDVGHADEGLYYIAEFVDGESLASRLRRGPLAPADACDIAEQLCRALEHAHAQSVMHRDIKPANVLLAAAGQVKLGDFGVARLAESSTDGAPGTIAGTPKYMAPEQARGLPSTPATDIYSVGVVLYEMLGAIRGIPRAVAQIAERATARDPAARYQSAREMAEALARTRAPLPRGRAAPLSGSAAGRSTVKLAGPVPRPSRSGVRLDATRIAPRMNPRTNVSLRARRESIVVLGLAFAVLIVMIVAAVLLASPGRVRVPQLRGLDRAAAIATTEHQGLRPTFTSRYDSGWPGVAIGQSPAPGARVAEGSTVRVVLSDGPPPVELPRLVGQTTPAARAILASLGLTAQVTSVPAPGVQAGTVVSQSPRSGGYVPAESGVVLSVAETPQWRSLLSFAGTGGTHSVPFRIRGSQWRIVYHMSYVGTCTWVIFCDGPTGDVVRMSSGSADAGFGLRDGGPQTHVLQSGPGLYEIRITPGSDTARWSLGVQDYY